MKVLLIHDKDPSLVEREGGGTDAMCSERAGGLAVYLAHVERGLRERGCETASVSFRDAPADVRATDGRHELRAFRYRLRPTVIAAVDRILAAERPDVVHAHSMPMLPGRLVNAVARGRPFIWTFHDVSPTCFRGTRLRPPHDVLCARKLGLGCVTSGCFRPGTDGSTLGDVARVATRRRTFTRYRHAARILVPSDYMRSLCVEHDLDGGRVDVLPLFSRFADRDVGPPPTVGTPTILFVGRLTREKGVVALVDALGKLADAPWTAQLVGDGPARSEVAGRVEMHGLTDRIAFANAAGPAALEAAYRASDIVVMPSIAPESFGLVGVEAMSMGRPVVAFDSGGVVEWLEDGVTGWLAAHGDVTDLARKIERRNAEAGATTGASTRRRRASLKLGLIRLLSSLSVLRDVFAAPWMCLAAWRAARREPCDVCLGFGPWGGLAGVFERRCGKARTFVYEDRDYEPGLVPAHLERLAAPLGDGVVRLANAIRHSRAYDWDRLLADEWTRIEACAEGAVS